MKKTVVIACLCLVLFIAASIAIIATKASEPKHKSIAVPSWNIILNIEGVGLEEIKSTEPKTLENFGVVNLTSRRVGKILSKNNPSDETNNIAGRLVRIEDKESLERLGSLQGQDNGIVSAPDGFFYTIYLTPLMLKAVIDENYPLSNRDKRQLSQIADSLKSFKDNGSVEIVREK